ncbi:GntP family permease [Nocardia jejuensis]|uniref:GntP family permease n=1 Tax=Nocardia jejuensis TaxID=328049 RepID=UPI0008351F58|nr:SLC13 family permease [Nocardia jejuensis]
MGATVDWLRTTTPGLLVLCGLAIALLLLAIIRFKLEPFIALLLTGLALALAAGQPVSTIVGTVAKPGESLLETGFGGILGHIAVIIGLGTVLGAILERSGGADVLTGKLLNLFGEKGAPVAMGLLGLIFGIPVFFDIGIFVLAPLVYVAAKRGGKSLVLYALPMLAGLSMTHAFLPPHPGPVALGGLLGVSLGWLIVVGFVCGIPGFIAAGIVWGGWIGRRVQVEVPAEFLVRKESDEQGSALAQGAPESSPAGAAGVLTSAAPTGAGFSETPTPASETATPTSGTAVATTSSIAAPASDTATPTQAPPSVGLIGGIIAIPLVLILGATFGSQLLTAGSRPLSVLTFLGTPAVALLISVLVAFYVLGMRRGSTVKELSTLTAESLRPVGMLLLVVGAGAFFGKVIAATGIGAALADTMSAAGLPVIVLAYLISCGLRIAQGSATVAIVTTGGIVQPLVTGHDYSPMALALIAMAIAAGSIILSHVNDGGFWIISKFFNLTVKQTLQTWTVLETVLSVVSFAVAALLFAILV